MAPRPLATRSPAPEHPAVRAWAALGGRSGREGIEELKVTKKSWVYRLPGAAPGGGAVVAKRRDTQEAGAEAEIYQRVLPRLPLPRLRYYGQVYDDQGCAWLFLEDAGDREYLPRRADHRAMAARWLGRLHASGADDDLQPLLRPRGVRYYRAHLGEAQRRVRAGIGNPALDAGDRGVLEAVLRQLDAVESRWQDVVRTCDRVSGTLVHGDFVGKNVRLVRWQRSQAMIALDWELAGRGSPAPDLSVLATPSAAAELRAYLDPVRERWPDLRLEDVAILAAAGVILRLTASVSWAARGLAYESVRRPMRHLRHYCESLPPAMARMGWA